MRDSAYRARGRSSTFVETQAAFLGAMVLFGISAALIGTSANAVVGDVVKGRGGPSIAATRCRPTWAQSSVHSLPDGWPTSHRSVGPSAHRGDRMHRRARPPSLMPETLPARTSPGAQADERERAAETEASHDT